MLAVRIFVGVRVRGLSGGTPPLTRAAAERQALLDEYQRNERQERRRELTALGAQVQRGAYRGTSVRVAADGSVSMRVDRHTYWSWYAGSMVAGLPLAIILSLRTLSFGWWGLAVVLGTVAVMAPIGFLIYELRARRGLARLTPDSLTVRAWYGGVHTIPRASIERVVLVAAELGSMRSYEQRLMLFLDGEGRCVAHLNGTGIPEQDWKAFAGAAGVPVDVVTEPMGPDELRHRYPHSISGYWSHQVAVGLALSVVITLAVVGAVLGWAAASGNLN